MPCGGKAVLSTISTPSVSCYWMGPGISQQKPTVKEMDHIDKGVFCRNPWGGDKVVCTVNQHRSQRKESTRDKLTVLDRSKVTIKYYIGKTRIPIDETLTSDNSILVSTFLLWYSIASCGMKLQSVLVVGGTGAQGSAVVRALPKAGTYEVIAITRSITSTTAITIASLPNVSLIEGNIYHEPTLRKSLQGVESAFVNTNGFAIGEKTETYWGIRIYELAREVGVKHFVWVSLDYGLKKAKYAPRFRSGHYDGKGRVGEFISAQPTVPMAWNILTSGPYMEMLC